MLLEPFRPHTERTLRNRKTTEPIDLLDHRQRPRRPDILVTVAVILKLRELQIAGENSLAGAPSSFTSDCTALPARIWDRYVVEQARASHITRTEGIPLADDQISEQGRQTSARWEQIGVDRIKADLLSGGHALVGGPPAVRDLAWQWVRMKEREAKQKAEKIVTLKPTVYGVGIDLRALWRKIWGTRT